MKILHSLPLALVLSLVIGTFNAEAANQSTAVIKKILIQQSIASYPGRCPCPYNRASNGSRCGKRSAWSKPGGYEPLCYEKDVTEDMVNEYQRKN